MISKKKLLSVRMTDSERKALDRRAKAFGMSTPDYVRHQIRFGDIDVTDIDTSDWQEALASLNEAGQRLNEFAKDWNTCHFGGDAAKEEEFNEFSVNELTATIVIVNRLNSALGQQLDELDIDDVPAKGRLVQRDQHEVFRLTDREDETLARKAKKAGVCKSQYVRCLASGGMISIDEQPLYRMSWELTKIGNNAAQMSALDYARRITKYEVAMYERLEENLVKLRAAIDGGFVVQKKF